MASVLSKRKRTAADAWIESLDPLNGLSIAQARNVYNAARRHGSPLLQKMYAEIEDGDPVLMTCVERRQSALAGLGWRTVANASAKDPTLAEEQRVALEEFANGIEDLDAAIEHLGLGFFRGYAVCQPIWEGNAVRHVELLDSWNFLRGDGGVLLWNPECSMDPAKCVEITPEARAVVFRRRRAIDWPALVIYIRKFIGERDWGRFLERYGIPPVDVVMAPNTTNEQRSDYLESAEAARDGRPAAWPAGSQISRAEGSRGQDPFSAFLEHQEKLVVLMATGGTLTSLAEADTGSLAGGAQMDVWTQIVARDGVAVSAKLNRALFAPFLREAFPGRPVLARLELGREDEPTAAEAADMAVKLRGAGYRVDQSQLEEATGYKLEREEGAGVGSFDRGTVGPWDRGSVGPLFNKAEPQAGRLRPREETALARAMQRDLQPVAKVLHAALQNRDWSAAKKRLAGILKECGTESAKVLEGAMRTAGESAARSDERRVTSDERTVAVANQGRKESGQFDVADSPDRTGRGHDREPETKGQRDDFGTTDAEKLAADPKENMRRGMSVVTHLLAKKDGFEPQAMYRRDVGWIGVDYGEPGNKNNQFSGGHGLSHILAKHPGAEKHLVDVLQNGEAFKHPDSDRKILLVKGRTVAVLSKHRTGRLLITDYQDATESQIAAYTSRGKYHVKGEN